MKRFVAVATLAAAASLSGLVAAPAQAASICFEYDIDINGQGQAGAQCLPG
jgi:hypothetical protein